MKSILITGGTGAFGMAFTRHLLAQPGTDKIIIYSRSEFKQFIMSQDLAPLDPHVRLRFMIGDIRDRSRLRRALQGISMVAHAAALKRIEVGQYNPIEMVKTNVDGAVNLIEAAQDAGVKKVVMLSTDKAFQPVSPYGTSKALAESLFLTANNTTGWDGPKFSVCRYGNVWNSTGSVVPIWRKMIAEGITELPVTDPDCTRFFMRMNEAVALIAKTLDTMKGGELIIPKLPAYRLGDVAEAMGAKIRITGLPKWEKKHESMGDHDSSNDARRMTVTELREVLNETA